MLGPWSNPIFNSLHETDGERLTELCGPIQMKVFINISFARRNRLSKVEYNLPQSRKRVPVKSLRVIISSPSCSYRHLDSYYNPSFDDAACTPVTWFKNLGTQAPERFVE